MKCSPCLLVVASTSALFIALYFLCIERDLDLMHHHNSPNHRRWDDTIIFRFNDLKEKQTPHVWLHSLRFLMQGMIAGHIVLCNGTRLNLVDFEGQVMREWLMESSIKCLKVSVWFCCVPQ